MKWLILLALIALALMAALAIAHFGNQINKGEK